MVNIENVRGDLFLGQLNVIELAFADIGNSYIYRFTKENIYTVVGPDFGEWQGQVLIFVILIYGLKKSIERWHETILDKLKLIGLYTSNAYTDLWMLYNRDQY